MLQGALSIQFYMILCFYVRWLAPDYWLSRSTDIKVLQSYTEYYEEGSWNKENQRCNSLLKSWCSYKRQIVNMSLEQLTLCEVQWHLVRYSDSWWGTVTLGEVQWHMVRYSWHLVWYSWHLVWYTWWGSLTFGESHWHVSYTDMWATLCCKVIWHLKLIHTQWSALTHG